MSSIHVLLFYNERTSRASLQRVIRLAVIQRVIRLAVIQNVTRLAVIQRVTRLAVIQNVIRFAVLQRTHEPCVPTLSLQSEKESTRE